MKSFYDILGVAPSADVAKIRACYLELAREYHPDRIPEHLTKLRADAEEKIKEINEAWAVLSDPTQRKRYDQKLQYSPPSREYPARAARAPIPRFVMGELVLDWLRARKDFVRWALIIGISALVLLIAGELIAWRGIKNQAPIAQQEIDTSNSGLRRVIRYDLRPVQFQTSQFAGRGTLSIQLLSVGLSESKTVVNFRAIGGDRAGFLLYEPPGGSTRTRVVMGKTVVVDRGLEEPYLIDGSGTKYYSTSGLLGGDQINFDLYNFTHRINFKPHEEVTLSAEFPPLNDGISAITFVLPALAKWQPEWRWSGIDLR